MIGAILSLCLLLAFVSINVAMLFLGFFRKGTSAFLRNIGGMKVPENEKKEWEKLYTLAWLTVGLWALWELRGQTLLGVMFSFLAFRSGANVGRLMVYHHHDARLIERTGGGRLLGMLSKVVKLLLLLEGSFLAAFALSYKVLSVPLRGGGTVGGFLLALWVGGFIFGLIFGVLISRNNRGVLLRDNVLTLAFFTVRDASTPRGLRDTFLNHSPEGWSCLSVHSASTTRGRRR
ncbi:hypothetical protein [Palaeococcus ferrophilus]|uniref:hypothetical protein n=1 Tax=Palaeococcus ferrophilus TaxID=83868 RepID=UPI0006960CCE|nr:hypothetical protein [Palaeococcus ferrophilus]